eukprot:Gb_38332 [translate_table: standard]
MQAVALSGGPKVCLSCDAKFHSRLHLGGWSGISRGCQTTVRHKPSRTRLNGGVGPNPCLSFCEQRICFKTMQTRTAYRRLSASVRAQADDGVLESKPANLSLGTVFPYVSVACLGAVSFGYYLGVVNVAFDYLAKDLGFAGDIILQAWVVSTTIISAVVGSFIGGVLAETLGRKKAFQLDAVPLVIGAILSAAAKNVAVMIIGLLFVGIGIGISSSIVPLYIFEISPPEIRGALGSVNQLFIWVGLLFGLVAGLPLAENPQWWRSMFSIAVVPALLMALGMAFTPESPHWLIKQGKSQKAETSITSLWGKRKIEEAMLELIASRNTGFVEEDASWRDLFSRHYWQVVSTGAALFLFQQLAGVNAVVYYSGCLFRSLSMPYSIAAGVLVVASNVIGTIVASILIDKMGRKNLLITSFLGMAASTFLIFVSVSWKPLLPYLANLTIMGTILHLVAFSLGAGPIPALLLPEIFSSRIRVKAVSLFLGMHWVLNFAIGLYFFSGLNKLRPHYILLAVFSFCLAAAAYITNYVGETKGRSMEEIKP